MTMLGEKYERRCPERALWLAVLLQAVIDANRAHGRAEETTARLKAQVWLRLGNPAFVKVCDMAGVCPKYFLNHYRVPMAGEHVKTGKSTRRYVRHIQL